MDGDGQASESRTKFYSPQRIIVYGLYIDVMYKSLYAKIHSERD